MGFDRKFGETRIGWCPGRDAGLLTLVALTEEILEKEPPGGDNRILLFLREPQDLHQLVGPAWLEHASVNLTALGSVSVLTLLTILITGYLLVARKFQAATLLVFVAMAGTVWALFCWLLGEWLRDREIWRPRTEDGDSAPSARDRSSRPS